jgi:hypothetical protein
MSPPMRFRRFDSVWKIHSAAQCDITGEKWASLTSLPKGEEIRRKRSRIDCVGA